ncbi:MAG: beta-hydroxyacyl-ACP dehydratase, partial [Treponema sp.]
MSVTKNIEALLPHRKPFLFVDEIISCDDNSSVCVRKFTDEDFFFKGHF